jgi:hypothetical protein
VLCCFFHSSSKDGQATTGLCEAPWFAVPELLYMGASVVEGIWQSGLPAANDLGAEQQAQVG